MAHCVLPFQVHVTTNLILSQRLLQVAAKKETSRFYYILRPHRAVEAHKNEYGNLAAFYKLFTKFKLYVKKT
jgi:hypothetical protein